MPARRQSREPASRRRQERLPTKDGQREPCSKGKMASEDRERQGPHWDALAVPDRMGDCMNRRLKLYNARHLLRRISRHWPLLDAPSIQMGWPAVATIEAFARLQLNRRHQIYASNRLRCKQLSTKFCQILCRGQHRRCATAKGGRIIRTVPRAFGQPLQQRLRRSPAHLPAPAHVESQVAAADLQFQLQAYQPGW